jgi:ATP-dependent Clp protease adaptor protein ClpS
VKPGRCAPTTEPEFRIRAVPVTPAGVRAAGDVTVTVTTAPVEVPEEVDETRVAPDLPWIVIVWNDPVNLMSYVVLVFQKVFGYSREKATKLMLEVHHDGMWAVSHGTREKAEIDVARLHAYGLWATMEKDSG